MSATDYTHGEMDVREQAQTWSAFTKFAMWASVLTLLTIGYAVFTVAIGLNWMVALVLLAGAAIVGGLVMGMGGGWVAAVVGLSAIAVFVQVCIWIAGIFL